MAKSPGNDLDMTWTWRNEMNNRGSPKDSRRVLTSCWGSLAEFRKFCIQSCLNHFPDRTLPSNSIGQCVCEPSKTIKTIWNASGGNSVSVDGLRENIQNTLVFTFFYMCLPSNIGGSCDVVNVCNKPWRLHRFSITVSHLLSD